MKSSRIMMLFVLSCCIIASRLFPHWANLTPVLALCLWMGRLGKQSPWSLLLPLGALAVTDSYLGFYPGWALNYASYVLIIFLGSGVRLKLGSFLAHGFVGATAFFLISNLGVWWTSGLYSIDGSGLYQCFQLALPFFRSTLAGTTFFMGLFFVIDKYFLKETSVSAVKRAS